MRRRIIFILALVIALSWGLPPALAQFPHFARVGASGPDEVGALTVTFKLAGWASSTPASLIAVADATAVYACGRSDGTIPNDPVTQERSETVVGSGDFTGHSRGHITGALALPPPAPTLACPPELQLVLISVSYSDVTVIETVSGSEAEAPGPFARTFVEL